RLSSLLRNAPVYYRGVEVGVVQETDVTPDGTGVNLQLVIRQPYARLVRTDSVFWNVTGASLNASLFKGLQFHMDSLKSLAVGGVAFASAGDPGAKQVAPGTVFPLYAEARKEWLDWSDPVKSSHRKKH